MTLLLKLVVSPWFWADVVLSVSGGLLVFWGLKLEKEAEPKENIDALSGGVKIRRLKGQRGWKILMTGIVVEVIAAFGISVISGLEIADLSEKTSVANLQSKEAEKQAEQANARAAEATKSAAESTLRSKLADERIVVLETERDKVAQQLEETRLAAKNATAAAITATNVVNNANVAVMEHLGRRLTAEQIRKLTAVLNGLPKGKVAFNLNPLVPDVQPFANDIAKAFVGAGFQLETTGSTMDMPTLNFIWVGTFGETNSPTDKAVSDTLTSMGFPSQVFQGSAFYRGVLYIDVGRK